MIQSFSYFNSNKFLHCLRDYLKLGHSPLECIKLTKSYVFPQSGQMRASKLVLNRDQKYLYLLRIYRYTTLLRYQSQRRGKVWSKQNPSLDLQHQQVHFSFSNLFPPIVGMYIDRYFFKKKIKKYGNINLVRSLTIFIFSCIYSIPEITIIIN